MKPCVCGLAARASESQIMWSPSSGLPAGGSRSARTLRHLIVTLIQQPHLSDADALSRSSVWGTRNCSSRASELIFIPPKGLAFPKDPAPASDCSHGCKETSHLPLQPLPVLHCTPRLPPIPQDSQHREHIFSILQDLSATLHCKEIICGVRR